MNNSTAMSADPIPPSTTHLAKAKLSFRLKGTDIAIKKGGQGCRISFNQTGTLYYGVIVESVSSQKFAVAPPDDVWTQISGESVNRGWYDHEGLCTVRRETIVDVIDDSNMMQIKINDPVTEDITASSSDDDDMDIEAQNNETKAPNKAESSSSSDGVHPSDDDDTNDDNDDDNESAVGVPPVQSTFQTNNASSPPPTMPERRKSNRKPKNKPFFDEDNYHNGR